MTIGKVDEVVEIELVNYFIKGNIALTKVDEDYPDNKLSGAEMCIRDRYSSGARLAYSSLNSSAHAALAL